MRLRALGGLLAGVCACEGLVGITDKTLAPDASSRAPDAGSGADPSAPCAAQPQPVVFCDDFDESNSVADSFNWQTITPAQSGSVAFDTTQFTSAPQSARVVAQPVTGEVQLGISRDLGSATAVHVAFDLRIDADSLSGAPEVGVVQFYARTGIALNFVVGPGAAASLQVYDESANPPALLDSPAAASLPPLRAWTRIVLAYDAAAGATVYADGRPIVQSARAARGGSLGASGIILGAAYIVPPGTVPLASDFDNVVVRVP